MRDLIAALLAWTVEASGLPPPDAPPQLVPLTLEALQARVCPGGGCMPAGMYHGGRVLYMNAALSYEGQPISQSYLVHELVHYLQHEARGAPKTCNEWRHRERQAYWIQERYLREVHRIYFPLRHMAARYQCPTEEDRS